MSGDGAGKNAGSQEASLSEEIRAFGADLATRPVSDHVSDGASLVDQERLWYEREAAEKHRRRKFKNDRLRQDMDLREKHAEKAVGLAQVAVACWIFLFAMAGVTNLAQGGPFLSDKALIALTSGATINVIAIYLVVVKGLFPPPQAPGKGKRRK